MNAIPSPYEHPCLLRLTGPALRPGGLALTGAALAALHLPPGAALLDVGCGPGATMALFARSGFRAYGLDPSSSLVRQAAGHGHILRARGEALPLASGVMDAVFCECVLSLTSDPKAALAEMRRVLVPGGYLVLADIHAREDCRKDPSPGLGPYSCLEGAVSLERMEARLRDCGFALRRREDHTDALKDLAARIILAHGSLEGFRRLLHGPRREGDAPCPPFPRAGYVMFIAEAV
ncbi:MAG: class I SAM-dependent methyltransferase [Desulfovibrio sp.]|jgi:SAM-dependent methyltransferase|nr:class I SAM-dependent methyltransferase [Desulfovibrio sp.]